MKEQTDKVIPVRRILIVLLSYLCVLSFAKINSLTNAINFYGGVYFGYNLGSIAIFVLSLFLLNRYMRTECVRRKVISSIGGTILGFSIVYGAYAHFVNDIFLSFGNSMLQVGCALGISVLTTPLVNELFILMERAQYWFAEEAVRGEVVSKKRALRFYLLAWMGIFLTFVPVFLNEWPGNFIYDAPYQIQNVVTGDLSTHHPLAHTLLMGEAYKWGERIGNVAAGFQLYTLLQMLVLSSAMAYAVLYIYKKTKNKCIWMAALLWFILFPLHMLFSITATKDVLFAAFFLYFMIFIIRYYMDKEPFRWYSYAGMISSGILALLYRNNMKHVLLLVGIWTILYTKGKSRKLISASVFVTMYLLAQIINNGLIQAVNAAEDSDVYRESLSVPLQCLARVACYRGHELDEMLYEEICLYIPADKISQYNPYISDPIKNDANEQLLKDNMGNFIKLFIKVGLEYPDEYFESIVTNTMGYWYPLEQGDYVSSHISLYHMLISVGEQIEKRDFWPGGQGFSYLFWANNYRAVPILAYFCRNAVYIWMYVFYLLWCILKKRKEGHLPGIWGLVYILTCLAGPMAALRYIYCLVVMLPLIIFLVMSQGNRDIEESSVEKICI